MATDNNKRTIIFSKKSEKDKRTIIFQKKAIEKKIKRFRKTPVNKTRFV